MQTRFIALLDTSSLNFTRFQALDPSGKVGYYPGVLIIEKGSAKGHFAVREASGRVANFDASNPEHAKLQKYPIVIGDITLDDVVRCGNAEAKAKCKLDHGSTVRDIVGSYGTFSREGDKVRANLTLLDSSPHKKYVEEIIATLSEKIGNSIDFDYFYDIQGENAVARCVKLNSVDIVDAPAATNSLFEEPTKLNQHMPLSPEDIAAIGTVVKKEVTAQMGEVKSEFATRFDEIKTKMEEGADEDAEKKKKKEDEADSDTKLAALVSKAALSAVQSVLPKATLDNLVSLNAQLGVKDPFTEKLDLCVAAGMSTAGATAHIARKFPEIYNTKFGNGGGQKGSAKATL